MMPPAPPAPFMPPPMMPPKKSKLPVLIVVFGLLSVILLGISMVTPWYGYKMEADFMGISMSSETRFDFNGVTADFSGITNTTAWKDMPHSDNTKGVYSLTQIMVLLGLVMCILLLVGGVLLMKGPDKKMLALVFGILAFVFAMLGPVMFMAQHPGAMKSDMEGSNSTVNMTGPWDSFTGSNENSGLKMSWGPGIGWIMGLMGFVFALLGFILVLMVKKPAAAPMGAPPMQGAPMQPPMMQPPMEQSPMQQQPMYPPPQPPQYPPQQPPQYPPPQAPQYPPQYPPK